MSVDITVSIVSYNSKAVLKDCIDSVINNNTEVSIEIIVVDNASTDGSSDLIKTAFPHLTLIENRENVGFGRAHNQSFRISNGKYFLILNPDTLIFPRALEKIITFMDKHKYVGVTGCKIFWDDEKNFMFPDLRIHSLKTAIFQFTPFCLLFPNSAFAKWYWKSAYRLWNSHTPISVEGITGGFMMVRREAFESVGMFDENFFLFFEEHDLLRRIKKKGWEIYYLPDAEIQHYFEESVRNSSINVSKVYMQSAYYYYRKHYKALGYYFIRFLTLVKSFIHNLESSYKSFFTDKEYSTVYPENGRLIIKWPPHKGTRRYLVEISYSPEFSDRGGMYVEGESLSLKSDILKRLPDSSGFLRILPVYADNSTGRAIQVIKITE